MGTKTLLNGVNDVAKRLGIIKGTSGEFASLSVSQHQVNIDLIVQMWNEFMIDMYDSAESALPNEVATATITLVTDDRDYSLASDLVQMRWPLVNTSDGHEIHPYPYGWDHLMDTQSQPSNFTGQATYAIIRPTDGELYLDAIPTANENGDQYTYYYDKQLIVSTAGATFPFSDTVFQMAIAPVAELVKREQEKDFDLARYSMHKGICVRQLTQNHPREYWTPDTCGANPSDPLEA